LHHDFWCFNINNNITLSFWSFCFAPKQHLLRFWAFGINITFFYLVLVLSSTSMSPLPFSKTKIGHVDSFSININITFSLWCFEVNFYINIVFTFGVFGIPPSRSFCLFLQSKFGHVNSFAINITSTSSLIFGALTHHLTDLSICISINTHLSFSTKSKCREMRFF
jgi:hypothetical protein